MILDPFILQTAATIKQKFPDSGLGDYFSGLAYQAQNQLDKATEAYQAALKKEPDAVEPLSTLVRVYLAQKQADKAVNVLNQSLDKNPKNIVAWNLKGEVLLAQDKKDDAEKTFEKPSISIQNILSLTKTSPRSKWQTGIKMAPCKSTIKVLKPLTTRPDWFSDSLRCTKI